MVVSFPSLMIPRFVSLIFVFLPLCASGFFYLLFLVFFFSFLFLLVRLSSPVLSIYLWAMLALYCIYMVLPLAMDGLVIGLFTALAHCFRFAWLEILPSHFSFVSFKFFLSLFLSPPRPSHMRWDKPTIVPRSLRPSGLSMSMSKKQAEDIGIDWQRIPWLCLEELSFFFFHSQFRFGNFCQMISISCFSCYPTPDFLFLGQPACDGDGISPPCRILSPYFRIDANPAEDGDQGGLFWMRYPMASFLWRGSAALALFFSFCSCLVLVVSNYLISL